jgi:hypothetical protein
MNCITVSRTNIWIIEQIRESPCWFLILLIAIRADSLVTLGVIPLSKFFAIVLSEMNGHEPYSHTVLTSPWLRDSS